MINLFTAGVGNTNLAAVHDAAAAMLRDIAADSTTGGAPRVTGGALSMSFGIAPGDFAVPGFAGTHLPFSRDPFERVMRDAVLRNIVPVIAAGNNPLQKLDDTTPQRLGGAHTPRIVVGAATRYGYRESYSRYRDDSGRDILTVYAIGDDVLTASWSGDTGYETSSGTSIATAQVAGLVAYYMATVANKNSRNVKAFLVSEARELKGTDWPVDDPQCGVHPRVGLRQNMISCVPPDPEHIPVAAPFLPIQPQDVSAPQITASATYLTDGPEVSWTSLRLPLLPKNRDLTVRQPSCAQAKNYTVVGLPPLPNTSLPTTVSNTTSSLGSTTVSNTTSSLGSTSGPPAASPTKVAGTSF